MRRREFSKKSDHGRGKNSQHTAHLAAPGCTGSWESSQKPADTGLKEDILGGLSEVADGCEGGRGTRGPRDHTDIGVGGPDLGQPRMRLLCAAGTGCQPARPRLLSRKARPVTSTQCSPTHKPSTSLLTDIKICSDKLSATAEIWSDVDFSNCLDRPRHEANLFLSTVIADADLRQEGPAACEKR